MVLGLSEGLVSFTPFDLSIGLDEIPFKFCKFAEPDWVPFNLY